MTIKSEFINRESELKYLNEEYEKDNFRFISVIGRRRLGKTRLIRKFLEDKNDFSYLLVPELNDLEVRLEIAESFHEKFGLNFLGTPSWDELFEKLFQFSEKKRIILVFDEFQRFFDINKSIFSYLQKQIDSYAAESKLFFIVSGSSIGMMHRIFDHAAPLYGRRTGQLGFEAFRFYTLKEWFPEFSPANRVHIYAIYGGTPKYLEEVESRILAESLKKILSRTSLLYSEPENLLKTEVQDSNTYFNIMKVIAAGTTTPSEIAVASGIKPTSIDYFLTVLRDDLDLIVREIPVCERKTTKKSIYLIKDNFFKFWFRFIYPNYSELELGNTDLVLSKIEAELDRFTGPAFEEITRQFLIALNHQKKLPFTFGKIAKQWGKFRGEPGKNTYEIDLAALNENTKEILFCECKWQKQPVGTEVLEGLIEKAKLVDWYREERKEYFAVMAREGFTNEAKRFAKGKGMLLFSLEDLDTVNE
ncbi:ATP-binding protein [Methanosarcina sp.]|uniref:ATP-binding protein n=1 Tax=Methanosarcina sp. TaxID=2213 RepID=UPI003C788696